MAPIEAPRRSLVGPPITHYSPTEFVVEIEGVSVGGWHTATGLRLTRSGPGEVSITRGASDNADIYEWFVKGDLRRVAIVQFHRDAPVVRYECEACDPVAYTAPDFERYSEARTGTESITFKPKSWKRVAATVAR